MQMRGYVLAALFMAVHGQDFHGIDVLRYGAHVLHAALLAYLAQGDGQQIAFAVRVPAEPRPALINVVIRHQHAVARGIDHPRGRGHVAQRVIAAENTIERIHVLQNAAAIARFLFVKRRICAQLFPKRHTSISSSSCAAVSTNRTQGRVL